MLDYLNAARPPVNYKRKNKQDVMSSTSNIAFLEGKASK